MIFRNRVAKSKLVEQLTLVTLQTAHHGSTSPRFASTKRNHASRPLSTDFCNKICQQPTSLIARPYGALDMSIHFTKDHSFHVGKEAVALRQLQQVLPLRSVR